MGGETLRYRRHILKRCLQRYPVRRSATGLRNGMSITSDWKRDLLRTLFARPDEVMLDLGISPSDLAEAPEPELA